MERLVSAQCEARRQHELHRAFDPPALALRDTALLAAKVAELLHEHGLAALPALRPFSNPFQILFGSFSYLFFPFKWKLSQVGSCALLPRGLLAASLGSPMGCPPG